MYKYLNLKYIIYNKYMKILRKKISEPPAGIKPSTFQLLHLHVVWML